ncbi:MAG: glycerophosphodiester phosphodiesterase [Saprospiraceae bacterium]|nr:glycerophosphodiester phosphodiesterase [Saprospiraceae bacterium]
MTRFFAFMILVLFSCQENNNMNIDIQGHRGCRGLYPENSIPAFTHALELGVNTLEFDVVISKDKEVIISHEPFMSHEICLDLNGEDISENQALKHNIYQLDYEEIRQYDCGSKYFNKFPEQKKIKVFKPSLDDLINAIRQDSSLPHFKSVNYNIEIKRRPEWDSIHHPDYKEFASLVIQKIKQLEIEEVTTVQCFDVETLQFVHRQFPEINLVYLIANSNSPAENMDLLGFAPSIYSPAFQLVDADLVEFCQKKKMRLIPWTVNEIEDMQDMITLGVDGIITDYPDRLIALIGN